MLHFEAEIKQFTPCLEVEGIEEAVYQENLRLQQNNMQTKTLNSLAMKCYKHGEIAEALVHWILVKNMDPEDLHAEHYISTIQEHAGQLERMNQSIKRYNTVLRTMDATNYDISMVQLRQTVENHPKFLKAWQLLALLCIQSSQLKEARDALKIARQLDESDERTQRYIQEMLGKKKKRSRLPKLRRNTVVYKEGNSKIIQPRAEIFRELSKHLQVVNIAIGAVIGAALIWFLIAPAVNQSRQDRVNASQIEFSQRIASMEAQISAQTRQLDEFRANQVVTEGGTETQATAQESFEALLTAQSQFDSGSFTFETIVDTLLTVNTSTLGAQATDMYHTLRDAVFPTVMQRRFNDGQANLEVLNFTSAIENFGRVVQMDPSYQEGRALLNLGLAYKGAGDIENATTQLQEVIRQFPNTDQATQAQTALDEIRNAGAAGTDTTGTDTGTDSTGTDATGTDTGTGTDAGNGTTSETGTTN